MAKIITEFNQKFPHDDKPNKETGTSADIRTDAPQSFWGRVAQLKDLNREAEAVRERVV